MLHRRCNRPPERTLIAPRIELSRVEIETGGISPPVCLPVSFEGFRLESLDQHRVEDRQKAVLILIADEPHAWNFAPLPVEKQNARRPEQPEALQ
jgi:hypothetical protein